MNFTKTQWTEADYHEFVEYLKSAADEKYGKFHSSLLPGIDNILGVRTPELKRVAKEISKGNYEEFLNLSGDMYNEETVVAGAVIGFAKTDYGELCGLVDDYGTRINNWAVCDIFCGGLKQIKKYKKDFFEYLPRYLESENQWLVRMGLVIMLSHYTDADYAREVLKRCDAVKREEYYIKMAQAWLVSICYIKNRELSKEYLENSTLDDWTFNKAIQKIRESRRISAEEKELLNKMKK